MLRPAKTPVSTLVPIQRQQGPMYYQQGVVQFIVIGLVGVVLLAGLYTWLTLTWSYSDGERAGFVQKLSHKGFVCKTWEGELAMVTMPGTLSEKFYFTVREDALADKINQLVGKKVALQYEQHVAVPSSCFGETEYFIVGVKEIQ